MARARAGAPPRGPSRVRAASRTVAEELIKLLLEAARAAHDQTQRDAYARVRADLERRKVAASQARSKREIKQLEAAAQDALRSSRAMNAPRELQEAGRGAKAAIAAAEDRLERFAALRRHISPRPTTPKRTALRRLALRGYRSTARRTAVSSGGGGGGWL